MHERAYAIRRVFDVQNFPATAFKFSSWCKYLRENTSNADILQNSNSLVKVGKELGKIYDGRETNASPTCHFFLFFKLTLVERTYMYVSFFKPPYIHALLWKTYDFLARLHRVVELELGGGKSPNTGRFFFLYEARETTAFVSTVF